MSGIRAQDAVADGIASTKQLLARYVAGFDDQTATAQKPGLPNHVCWSLGHLALTMYRVAEKFDGRPAPASDIEMGPRSGSPGAFASESVSFGSAPAADPAGYPSLARSIEIYSAACDRLASAVRSASDEKFAEPTPWGNTHISLGLLAARMIFHNGMHTGQIADLRRAMGFKSIFS